MTDECHSWCHTPATSALAAAAAAMAEAWFEGLEPCWVRMTEFLDSHHSAELLCMLLLGCILLPGWTAAGAALLLLLSLWVPLASL